MKVPLRKFFVEWRSSGYGTGGGHSTISGHDIRDALKRSGRTQIEECLKYGINWYEEVKPKKRGK